MKPLASDVPPLFLSDENTLFVLRLLCVALSHEAAPAAVKAEQVGKRVLQAIQEQAVALGAAAAGDGAGGGGGGGGGAVGGLAAEGKAADVVAANEHHINSELHSDFSWM